MADTTFQIDLGVSGVETYESAAVAVTGLAEKLTAAKTAATAAADSVAAGEAAYKQAEAAANRASQALEKIGLQATAQEGKVKAALEVGDFNAATVAQTKLASLIAKQTELAEKSTAAKATLDQQAASLDKLKSAASSAADAETKIAKGLEDAKKKAAEAAKAQAAAAGSGKVNEIAEGFGKLGGPLGQVGQKIFGAAEGVKKLTASLGEAGGPYAAAAIAAVALVAGIAAITIAAIAGTAAIAAWAVGLADTARTSALLSDGIAGTVAGGRQLDAAISGLATKVPQTREELLAMAGDLRKSGLEGKALTDALETAAVKAAKVKWGPDFQKQTLSLTNQSARLKAGIAGIFGGLKIEGLLEGLSKLVGLFDASSASGNAIKVVFESIFQPIIDGATKFIPKIIAAFLQFEIYALKTLIAVKPYASYIAYFGAGLIAVAAIITGVFVVAIAAIAAPFIIAGVAIAAVIAALIWLWGALPGIGAAISNGLGAAWDYVTGKVTAAINFLKGLSLSEIGTAMIDGLVAGITSAGSKVLSAITGIASGAVTGAKKMLGIASPSKVFAEIGEYTGEGMAIGIDRSASGVQDSLEGLTTPPATQGASGGGGKGGGLNFAGATFVLNGVQGAEDAESRIDALLTRLIEGDTSQLGVSPT